MSAATTASPTGRIRWRLRPAARKTVMAVHVFAGVALAGELWVLVVVNLYATVVAGPALSAAAYHVMGVLIFTGGAPLSLTALASGVLLSLTSRWGLTRHWWVFTKLVLLVVLILAGVLLFQPAETAATVEQGMRTGARQWEQVAVVSTQLAMAGTATALAVFKPRGRTPWSR